MLRGHFPLARLGWVVALLLVGGTGCSYIGQSAFEEKRASLDHDGDGAPLGGPDKDCDDYNDKRTPGAEEIPYDGWDNDCDGADVVDADLDGYPGITKATYLALNPDAVWPDSVVEGPLDCADDPIAQPYAANVFPGNPNEVPYDGVDADCGMDNDFDNDLDGYMPNTVQLGAEIIDVAAAYNTYVQEWGLDLGTPQYGDCNDLDSMISPAMSVEDDIWYDGKDTNCDGANDFDADGDTYMFNEDQYAQDFVDYVQFYHGGVSPWPVLWGDCLDQENPNLAATPGPADVNPGITTDTPYDGIDEDCLADNDFDGDGDGYMPDSAASGGFDDYVANWGYTSLVEQYGDCDDTIDYIYTGALERFGDLLDSDCDGVEDGTPFGFNGYAWTSPRPPRVDGAAGKYILLTSAESADISGIPLEQTGHAIYFDNTSGYDAVPLALPGQWVQATTTYPLAMAVDLQMGIDNVTGDSFGWTTTSSFNQPSNNTTLWSRRLDYLSFSGGFINGELSYGVASATVYDGLSADVLMDSEQRAWAVACGDMAVQATRTRGSDSSSPSDILPIPSGVCFWDSVPDSVFDLGEFVTCDPGLDCEQYVFDADADTISLAASNNWAGETLDYGQYREGWHHLIHSGQTGGELRSQSQSYVLLDGYQLSSFDADWRDTNGDMVPETVYAVGVGEASPPDGVGIRLVMAYGDPSVGITTVEIPFGDSVRPNLVLNAASVHSDDDRLFIGISATNTSDPDDEAIGWAFFGW